MKSGKFTVLAGIALAFLLVLGINSNIAAQGRGGGRPSGNPGNSGGSGGGMGRGGNSGVDRGIDTSSDRSNGRSDRGRDTASDRSNGRSDDGMNRAREGGRDSEMNRNMPKDNELNRYRGIAGKLNTTPENLRAQYQAAQAANPDLKFGQFVAANMIAGNLSSRYPNVTSAAILSGLRNGDSIGKTLQNLGVSSSDAKDIEKRSKREMKESKKQN